MRFENQVAIIAGGAGGIGKAIALQLANEGAKVIVWDLNEEALKETKNEIETNGGVAETNSVNVMSYEIVETAVNEVVEKFGRVDIMVACVGGGTFKPLVEYTNDFWNHQINYNLNTTFNCLHTALKHMVKQNYGRLFCFMSTTGGVPGLAGYGAAKAGCKALLESIHAEHCKQHITINAVLPSFTPTPFTMKTFQGEAGKAQFDAIAARMPLGPNTPENVAATVLDLLANERCSGQIIHLM